MEQRAQLNLLLSQIAEMLEAIQKPQKPLSGTDNPRILRELEWLETSLQTLNQCQEEVFRDANLDINQATKEILESPAANSSDKQLLKRAQEIQRDATALHLALSKAIQKDKGRKKTRAVNGNTKEQMKERRKLFKPLGGDKTWIPL